MLSPKVSFILPAYKGRFLSVAIDSILTQTYDNFNIIIVNDASPDNIDEIICEKMLMGGGKILYYKRLHNLGCNDLVKAWNDCLQYADGDFIVLASDDDVYSKNFLSDLITLSNKYPSVDVFHTRVGIIDQSDEMVYVSPSIAEYETDIDFIYQRTINRRPQQVSDFMVRTSALKQLGGFVDYPKGWYSDEMTWYSLAKNKGAVCSLSVLFFFRSSGINISSRNDDINEKAKASLLHYLKMGVLLNELCPKSKIDNYLLQSMRLQYRKSIATQLKYDMVKTSIRYWNLLFNREYKELFYKKIIVQMIVEKIRFFLEKIYIKK
ncbi:MAG: glycosyltransferase [Prevotellaceae bacterium]|jgi:glycosyltransferase involved in cell wall biosynthesis|nr:glycosyltransferase [Prevotellaceae bacterium]